MEFSHYQCFSFSLAINISNLLTYFIYVIFLMSCNASVNSLRRILQRLRRLRRPLCFSLSLAPSLSIGNCTYPLHKLTRSKYATNSVLAWSFSCDAVIPQKNACLDLSTCLISKWQRGKSVEFPGECQASFDFIVCNCNKIKYRIRITKNNNFFREILRPWCRPIRSYREKLRNPAAHRSFLFCTQLSQIFGLKER